MRIVLQRVKSALVKVAGEKVGEIENGVVLFVGITHDDTEEDAAYLAHKVTHLRIFEDEDGKMNDSLYEVNGQALSVSQFTLYGDCRKGRRPNFMAAAKPEHANLIYEHFNECLSEQGITVETGKFGAMMDVELTNDGPVTLILESNKK